MDRATATRRLLQEHALRLFSERGFDDVTVEEVARAAGFSHMTFFRHFPTKDAVVLDDPYDPVLGARWPGRIGAFRPWSGYVAPCWRPGRTWTNQATE